MTLSTNETTMSTQVDGQNTAEESAGVQEELAVEHIKLRAAQADNVKGIIHLYDHTLLTIRSINLSI